jgi:hypothetical protein
MVHIKRINEMASATPRVKGQRESIEPYLVDGAVLVIENATTERNRTDESITTVDTRNRFGVAFMYDRNTMCFYNDFDENLECSGISEHNEWLTGYIRRITRVYAPHEDMSKEQVVKTQEPVWVNPDNSPLVPPKP